MITYPNQKIVCINRDMPKQTKENKKPFMIAYIEAIEAASRNIHKPSSFKLFMYLIGNRDEHNFALSPQDFSNRYGVSLDSAKDAVNDLISLGYLVQREKKVYDFYESPKMLDVEPVEEEKRRFHSNRTGEVFELTYNELIERVGKEKAEEAWRRAK